MERPLSTPSSPQRPPWPPPLLAQELAFLAPIEHAFSQVRLQTPHQLPCSAGCARCCVSFFEITLTDVWRLRRGLEPLPALTRQSLLSSALQVLAAVQQSLPTFVAPWDVRTCPEALDLVAQTLVIPCPALDTQQRCQVYEGRPRICRLQGLSFFEPEQPEIVLEDGCAPVFGDEAYARLPAQPLPLLEQWEQEVALRNAVWETFARTLPEGMTAGYRTFVAGALALLLNEEGQLTALFSESD